MKRRKIIFWALLSLFFYLPMTFWSSLPLWSVMLLSPTLALLVLGGLQLLFRPKPAFSAHSARSIAGSADFIQNQDFDFNDSPCCPHCNSSDVAKMIYGKPALTRQMFEGLESGKIISGGCMIHGGAPEWHCNHCHQDFGHLTFDQAEKTEKMTF